MSEKVELMTNRQLARLCAKGLCEWGKNGEHLVRHSYDYQIEVSDEPVSEDIAIRPYEKIFLTDANEKEWYRPTEEAYIALLGSEKAGRMFGF